MSENTMSKETQLFKMLTDGSNYTRADLIKELEISPKVLASYLTSMRTAARLTGATCYPIEDEVDGQKVFKVMGYDEAQAILEARLVKTVKTKEPKDPKKMIESYSKRIRTLEKQISKLKAEATPLSELKLAVAKAQLALLKYQLAAIEPEDAEDTEADVEDVDVDVDVDDEDEDEDEDFA